VSTLAAQSPDLILEMWQPSCSIEKLKARAEFYAQIRAFFYKRNVLEVETPLLSISTATDPHLESICALVKTQMDQVEQNYFLHTSPEFPMKRLLASGSGSIYQICKTFRNGETGSRHNPEFTMLEWYRPGFSLDDLMSEVESLIYETLAPKFTLSRGIEKLTYRESFLRYLSIDPFEIADADLEIKARELTAYAGPDMVRDDYLNLLLSICIEPQLGKITSDKKNHLSPVFLYEYPPSQASLAQVSISKEGISVAQRFELYIDGLELANGYFELTDPKEQVNRFEQDNAERRHLNLPEIPFDINLISALKKGLPACAGVALGLDRLLMVRERAQSISEVLAFPIERA